MRKVQAQSIRIALRDAVSPVIYRRGVEYYREGLVERWWRDDQNGLLVITGEVRGSKRYEVTLEFDVDNEDLIEVSCSCPYDDVCKHIVALGLTFADSLEQEDKPRTAPTSRETDEWRGTAGGCPGLCKTLAQVHD